MDKMQIKSAVLGMAATNCYFAINKETKETLIIDPAASGERLIRFLTTEGLKPVAMLLTHGHVDHILAVNDLRERFGIPVYAHEAEKAVLTSTRYNLSTMFGTSLTIDADVYLKDGQKITLAGFEITVLHTPGHTPGGCCFYIPSEKVLFSGDTLFHYSIGRTDFPGGSMSQLVRAIKEKLFVLPEDTNVLPGHESATQIGFEKKHNPFCGGDI